MNTTETGFFATVATIIPVFAVAYVVGVKGLISETLGPRHLLAVQERRRLRLSSGKRFGELQPVWRFVIRTLLPSNSAELLFIAQCIVFSIAVILPAIGEYEALHALFAGHASSTSKHFAFIGALASGFIVITPIVLGVLKAVWVGGEWNYLLGMIRNLSLVAWIYYRWNRRGNCDWVDWAEDGIIIEFGDLPEDMSEEMKWVGKDELRREGPGILAAYQPDHVNDVGDSAVLVTNKASPEEEDEDRTAILFEMSDRRKVKRIVIYCNCGNAPSVNP